MMDGAVVAAGEEEAQEMCRATIWARLLKSRRAGVYSR